MTNRMAGGLKSSQLGLDPCWIDPMTAGDSETTEFIDLTLSSSGSESDTSTETETETEAEDEQCPFNPPIDVSGNILSSHHHRILNSRSSWFTDDIINAFFCKLKESAPHLLVFSSFFYEALMQKGQEYCLKHWLTASFKEFLSSHQLEDRTILFPVNSGGSHWVLVAWELSIGEMFYYDSLMCKRSGNLIMKRISGLINQFLDEDELDRAMKSLSLENEETSQLNVSKIKLLSIPKGQLQQSDGSSCGPFCCFFAKKLVEKTGTCVDIYEFRKGLVDFFSSSRNKKD